MSKARLFAIAVLLVVTLVCILFMVIPAQAAPRIKQCPHNIVANGCYTLGGGSDITVVR